MKNLDRIERYIDHEMDENELWEFERDLRNDPQLAEELAFMQALSARANSSNKLKLMDLMDNIRQEEEKKSRLVIFSKRALAYAASLLVLIAAGIGLWHYGGNVSNEIGRAHV